IGKLAIQVSDFVLATLPIGNVVLRFQDSDWSSMFVSLKGPATGDENGGSVRFRLCKFPFPTSGVQQFPLDLFGGHRKNGMQQILCASSDRLFRRPAIQLFRTVVPIRDHTTHIANKNRIVRQIEQVCLLGSDSDFFLKFIAGLQQITLYAPADSAEPS